MATTIISPTENGASKNIPSDPPKMARYGISLIINNKAAEAHSLFQSNSESIQMAAGYSFSTFMDALMSFEEDKLEVTLTVLRDMEKRCASDVGWLKSIKGKVLGQKSQSIANRLETQIILADTQVCVAIITFLQQEFSGYLKGGWVLRKAFKVYQHTYAEIIDLYKNKFGDFNLPEPTDFEWNDESNIKSMSRSTSASTDDRTADWSIPDSGPSSPSPRHSRNGYVPISSPSRRSPNIPHSQSSYFSRPSSFFNFSIRRSGSAHSSLSNKRSVDENSRSSFSLWSPLSSHLSYLSSTFNLLSSSEEEDEIQSETITRLMGAVCFGYGVLQLGISLLPPSLLKLTNFFGFNGNRVGGISNLMYARKGTDMRAPLATLALLWFHTIVRPFYALDGSNVKAGIDAANLLIQESLTEYQESALFLFFKGRVHRLDRNISVALEAFQAAATNTPQREIKLLALHEVGWCHLIQLNFQEAQKVFLKLKNGSRWSKAFYAYLSIICSGSFDRKDFSDVKELGEVYMLTNINKSTPLDLFLKRRLHIYPKNEESFLNTNRQYWKFLVYELLFLWNTLPSCSAENLNRIIKECNEPIFEPMSGLANLIQGECYNILENYSKAIESFRKSISARNSVIPNNDLHISANAEYALGALLVKDVETQEEGRNYLQHATQYRDYDFDHKLSVRINMALKNVS